MNPDEFDEELNRIFDENINRMRRHDDWRNTRCFFWRRFLFYVGIAITLAISYVAYHTQ